MEKTSFDVTCAPDSSAVREQLDRVLHSIHFRNSKRCQALLKYVVEEAAGGNHDQLKERTIGVQVFGRQPAYDTNQDAVVRNAAVEVRKRLAQYYLDPAHENQMRISLPLGAYAPDFAVQAIAPAELERGRSPKRWRTWGLLLFAAVAIIGAYALARYRAASADTELRKFWGPILDAPEVAQICVGQPRRVFRFDGPRHEKLDERLIAGKPAEASSVSSEEISPAGKDLLYFRDGYAMARVAALLQAGHKSYHLRNDSTTPFSEVRRSPLILIGAFNNLWTIRLMSALRYTFATGITDGVRYNFILDHRNPNDRRWRVRSGSMWVAPEEDYLIVTRVLDSTTERAVVLVAGFKDYGTLAAGEFATDAAYLKKAFRDAPNGWEKKNIQVVLRARFIEGTPGPPEVLAMHFW